MGPQDGQGCAGDVDGSEHGGFDLRPEVLRGDLLEEAGVEVARVVHQDVDPGEPVHGGLDSGRGGRWVGDVQRDGQQVVVLAHSAGDLLRVTSGGHDGMACGQRRLRDVGAHASAGAGDEPDLLLGRGLLCSVM